MFGTGNKNDFTFVEKKCSTGERVKNGIGAGLFFGVSWAFAGGCWYLGTRAADAIIDIVSEKVGKTADNNLLDIEFDDEDDDDDEDDIAVKIMPKSAVEAADGVSTEEDINKSIVDLPKPVRTPRRGKNGRFVAATEPEQEPAVEEEVSASEEFKEIPPDTEDDQDETAVTED